MLVQEDEGSFALEGHKFFENGHLERPQPRVDSKARIRDFLGLPSRTTRHVMAPSQALSGNKSLSSASAIYSGQG
jgi:hypothetical protein